MSAPPADRSSTTAPDAARDEGLPAVLAGMLLQRHAALGSDLRSLTLTARVLATALALYAGLLEDAGLDEILAVAVPALILNGVWVLQRRRWYQEMAGIERTVAESVTGLHQEVYIRSRYYTKQGAGPGAALLAQGEALLWLVAIVAILVAG